jgi:hypothetical protein
VFCADMPVATGSLHKASTFADSSSSWRGRLLTCAAAPLSKDLHSTPRNSSAGARPALLTGERSRRDCSCLRLGGQEGLHLHADHAPAGSVRKVDVVKVAEEGLRVGIRELCQ